MACKLEPKKKFEACVCAQTTGGAAQLHGELCPLGFLADLPPLGFTQLRAAEIRRSLEEDLRSCGSQARAGTHGFRRGRLADIARHGGTIGEILTVSDHRSLVCRQYVDAAQTELSTVVTAAYLADASDSE